MASTCCCLCLLLLGELFCERTPSAPRFLMLFLCEGSCFCFGSAPCLRRVPSLRISLLASCCLAVWIYIYILIDCQCVVWDSDLFWLIEELYFLTFLRYLVNSLTWTKQQLCDLVWNSHLWIFRFKGGWGGFPAKLQDVEFLIPPSLRSQPPKPSPGEPDWRTSRKQSKDDTPDNEFGKRVARFQLCMLSLQVKPLFLFWK